MIPAFEQVKTAHALDCAPTVTGTGTFGTTYINAENFPEPFKVLRLRISDKVCFYWQKMQHMHTSHFLNKH
jgi:hypothetical protein